MADFLIGSKKVQRLNMNGASYRCLAPRIGNSRWWNRLTSDNQDQPQKNRISRTVDG